MGELITQDESVAQWLKTVDSARSSIVEAVKSGNRFNAAMAEAKAKLALIKAAKDPQIAGDLLAVTDPDIAMVEMVNDPSEQQRIRIGAIAMLQGFVPGKKQFSIYGGGWKDGKERPATLYLKEAGYRTLFAQFGVVPQVEAGHAELHEFDAVDKYGKKKKLWRISGHASCEFGGRKYDIKFGDGSEIEIAGNDSDNIAGIKAKARRAMLQILWNAASPVFTDEVDDGGIDDVPQDNPAAITHEPTSQPEVSELQRDRLAVEQQFERCRSKLENDAKQLEFFNDSVKSIDEAETLAALKSIGEAMKDRNKERKVSEQIMQELRRFWEVRQRELQVTT